MLTKRGGKKSRKRGVELHRADWWECAGLRSGEDREYEAWGCSQSHMVHSLLTTYSRVNTLKT